MLEVLKLHIIWLADQVPEIMLFCSSCAVVFAQDLLDQDDIFDAPMYAIWFVLRLAF